jgi:hypothetical protein
MAPRRPTALLLRSTRSSFEAEECPNDGTQLLADRVRDLSPERSSPTSRSNWESGNHCLGGGARRLEREVSWSASLSEVVYRLIVVHSGDAEGATVYHMKPRFAMSFHLVAQALRPQAPESDDRRPLEEFVSFPRRKARPSSLERVIITQSKLSFLIYATP